MDQQLSNCHVSLRPTNARCYVHTSLQFDGAATHLASPLNKQVKDSLTAAMDTAALIPYFDDPFGILSVAYEYFAKRITEPPDCILQYLWMMFWHIFWALCYVFRGCCMLKYRLDSAYLSGMYDPIVPDKPPPRNSMTVHCFTTGSDGSIASPNDLISFDTDGIPFILDSGADCIISNVRALFQDLKPMDVYVKTANGTERRQRYVGTFTLQLPDDNG
eukprot:scaffold17304_cov160-Skeletonema_dohrnii-CCMP3373.AAC.1